jgi:hypothetical protein
MCAIIFVVLSADNYHHTIYSFNNFGVNDLLRTMEHHRCHRQQAVAKNNPQNRHNSSNQSVSQPTEHRLAKRTKRQSYLQH